MSIVNLGMELKALADNITHLIMSISTIRLTIEHGREKLPLATDKLEKITTETESATQQVMDVLDSLQQNDTAALECIQKLDPLFSHEPAVVEILESLRGLMDKNQTDHTRILETLQFQDLTSQQINYVSSVLDNVENELNALLLAFGSDEGNAIKKKNKVVRAFDSKATFSTAGAGQAEVGSILKDE